MNTDSHELPPEAYARELQSLDRTAEAVVWCAISGCKSPIGSPGFTGGKEAALCQACEAERLKAAIVGA